MEPAEARRHFIQYHNPERYGPPQPPDEGQVFSVLTRKRAERVKGAFLWAISGDGRPRRYFLYKVFLVDWVGPALDPDFFYEIAGARGVYFQPAIELTGYPWFDRMKRRLGNFSLGLTEITHTYARYLVSLAQEISPEYRVMEKGEI